MSDWTTVVAVDDLPPGKHMSVEVEGAVMVLVNLDGEFYCHRGHLHP